MEEDLVLWRTGGKAIAWQDLCIHRGARLSLGSVKNDHLSCKYHGWTYDVEGKCDLIPAHPSQKPPERAVVATYLCREKYGLIWVSLKKPEKDIPVFPEWDDPAFRAFFAVKGIWNASGPRVVESALDIAHFPFVHAGLLGDPKKPEVSEYEAIIEDGGVSAQNIKAWLPSAETLSNAGSSGEYVDFGYRVLRPLSLEITEKWTDGRRFAFFMAITPVDRMKSISWALIAMDYDKDIPEKDFIEFQKVINSQDTPVVESQRPELLPLDLQAELHLRSDRMSIAYRKWLKQLGVTFGTS